MRQATESIEAADNAARLQTGTIIGDRFRIESLFSREGATVVYRATDTKSASSANSDSPVALRIVPFSAIVHGPDRLLDEVEKTQLLRHKNLVEVEAVGGEADFLFVASEFIDGQSLREFIDAKRAEGRCVSLKGAANLVAHVSNALDYAKRVTLHGALNPALIWVNNAGRVKVSGLGLASGVPSLARHGASEGSPETVYVAPEVLAGGAPTQTSDVYSLGVILYELLTGQPPGTPFLPASGMVSEVPPAVDAVIERALTRDPDARWPSTTALKDALQTAAGLGGHAASRGAGASVAVDGSGGSPAARPTAPVAAFQNPRASAPPDAAVAARRHSPIAGPVAVPAAMPVEGPHDNEEKWLIQKDNLDFGPFSMKQIRAQIERGEILAEHVLIDNDLGSRGRVKEYPGLGDLAKISHRRLEQVRRAQAEHRSEKSEKKKSLATKLIVTAVVLAVLGGVGFYVVSRRDSAAGQLASREEEAEIESFLKGVKIGGMKASVKRATHRGSSSGASVAGGGSAEDFNNDVNLGDVSKPGGGGDQTLDDNQIQDTMMANYKKLIPCIVHTGVNEVAMEFVVRGTGKVSAVKVNGQRAGTLPGCILGRMQSFNFPKFDGSKTIASWSMSMGR
jgi:hypothetical protein